MQANPMQIVVAFIPPFQLDRVVDAVRDIPSFPGMSVSTVRRFGSHAIHPPQDGGQTEIHALEARLRLEIFCRPAELMVIIESIRKAAYTVHQGDGRGFAGPVMLAYRVRPGDWDEPAVLPSHRPATQRAKG